MYDVDVIIPVHGTPVYLSETIQSIVSQSYVNKIIVILDRVDKDYFSKINIEHHNLVVVISNTPGIVSALNTGLKISKAEFIARIDSDDVMCPDRIVNQRNFLISNPMCVCVGSSIEIFNARSTIRIKQYPTSHKKIIEQLTYQNAIAHPSVMYRRKAVRDVGFYRPLFEGSEDYDLWLRLSKIGHLNNINFSFTKYRVNADQYSSKFSPYRVELDSLVRLLNLANIKELPILDYNKTMPGSEIKKCYQDLLNLVKKSNNKLYKDLKNAERLSVLLQAKSRKNTSKFDFGIIVGMLLRLILRSPKFLLKVLIGRVIV